MWGNSPELTQAAYKAGESPTEQWMNPDAENLMKVLRGTKPFAGWNGRLNGPGMCILHRSHHLTGVSQLKLVIAFEARLR